MALTQAENMSKMAQPKSKEKQTSYKNFTKSVTGNEKEHLKIKSPFKISYTIVKNESQRLTNLVIYFS